MLPLDPPLSPGARPGWMNPKRPFDDAEPDALDADPDDPRAQVRLARHLLGCDPEYVRAMLIVARDARSDIEQARSPVEQR